MEWSLLGFQKMFLVLESFEVDNTFI